MVWVGGRRSDAYRADFDLGTVEGRREMDDESNVGPSYVDRDAL
jgi:hypothetical protein